MCSQYLCPIARTWEQIPCTEAIYQANLICLLELNSRVGFLTHGYGEMGYTRKPKRTGRDNTDPMLLVTTQQSASVQTRFG